MQGRPPRQTIAVNTMIRGRRSHALAICTLGIAVAGAALSRSGSAADFPAPDALMSRLMSTYHVLGAALALIKDGRIVVEKGYGYRDLTTRAPVTTATLFNIGSVSKSFTALDIAKLVDQRRVDLDAPVIRYLPDLRLSDPQATRTLTLRQLLSHTSGLPPDDQWPRQVPLTRQGIIAEFATMPITAPPGRRFQYCSRCIVLAACVLERIVGQSWEAYTRTHIFTPLGMTAASFGPVGLEQASDHAQPYHHDPVLGQVPVPWGRLQYLIPLAPAGGIDATIDGMAGYALLQLGDGTIFGHRVVTADMLAELHRPEIAVEAGWSPFAPAENLHYALGWFTADTHGVHLDFHNGANPGFRSSIFLVPAFKAAVVILTNGESDHFTAAASRSLLEQMLH